MFCSFLLSRVTLLFFHQFVDFTKKIKRLAFNYFLFKQLIVLITCFTFLIESVNCYHRSPELSQLEAIGSFHLNVMFFCSNECAIAILDFTLPPLYGGRPVIVPLKREFESIESHRLLCSYIVSPLPLFPLTDPGEYLSGSIDRCPGDELVVGLIHNDSLSILIEKKNGLQFISLFKRKELLTFFSTEKPHNYLADSINPVKVKGYATVSRPGPYHLKVVFIWYSKLASMFGNYDTLVSKSNLLITLVNSLFKPLNVIVTLMDVLNSTVQEEIPENSSGFDALTLFQKIRRDQFLPIFENFTTIFIVSSPFNDHIGFSPLGAICSLNDNAIWISWLASITRVSALIVHELGHNLGLEHLTSSKKIEWKSSALKCSKCIMTSDVTILDHPIHWSLFSLEKFTRLIDTRYGKCLLDPPKNYLTANCGNGIIEAGEECEWTKSHQDCCHKDSCLLTEFACCGSGPCCNPSTCRPYNLTDRIACREKVNLCDLAEYCDGNSEFCPEDTWIRDFYYCPGGHCYEGKCLSLKNNCNLLWNDHVNRSDLICYERNTLGIFGNDCGYDRKNQSFIPCAYDDIFCGRLQCSASQNVNFQFHGGNTTHVYSNHSNVLCASSVSDIYPKDPGMVPDGTACGRNKVCINAHCINISTLPTYIIQSCPEFLIPDNRDQCRCTNGFSDTKSCIKPSEPNNDNTTITPEYIGACRSHDSLVTYKKFNSEESSQFDMGVFAIFFGIAAIFIIFVVACIFWLHYHPNIRRKFCVSRTPDLSAKENGERSENRIALNSY